MISQARRQAEKSTYLYRLGAVIHKGKRILSVGHNSISHCEYNNFNNSRHAEMDAIMNCDNVEDAVLFIAGIKKNGQRVYCKPCEYCMKIIGLLPFKAVYYETKEGIEVL